MIDIQIDHHPGPFCSRFVERTTTSFPASGLQQGLLDHVVLGHAAVKYRLVDLLGDLHHRVCNTALDGGIAGHLRLGSLASVRTRAVLWVRSEVLSFKNFPVSARVELLHECRFHLGSNLLLLLCTRHLGSNHKKDCFVESILVAACSLRANFHLRLPCGHFDHRFVRSPIPRLGHLFAADNRRVSIASCTLSHGTNAIVPYLSTISF